MARHFGLCMWMAQKVLCLIADKDSDHSQEALAFFHQLNSDPSMETARKSRMQESNHRCGRRKPELVNAVGSSAIGSGAEANICERL